MDGLATGVTRNLSLKFAENMLNTVHHDLKRKFGRWEVRELIDRNYSENANAPKYLRLS